MSQDTAAALSALRRATATGAIGRLCKKHKIALLVLFGSSVNHFDGATQVQDGVTEAPEILEAPRDIDLALLPEGDLDQLALLTDLYDLIGSEQIDLMRLDRAGVVARQRALTRGICLFERGSGRFAEAQIAAAMEYYDTEPLRVLQRELLATP